MKVKNSQVPSLISHETGRAWHCNRALGKCLIPSCHGGLFPVLNPALQRISSKGSETSENVHPISVDFFSW